MVTHAGIQNGEAGNRQEADYLTDQGCKGINLMAPHRCAALCIQDGRRPVMLKPFYIIPRTGGLAYLNMPKSACTSILHHLVDMRADTDPAPTAGLLEDGSDAVHGFSPPYAHLEYFFGRWPLDHPPIPSSFITFTFVRNPYARFYSFYKSKIKLGQTPGSYYRKFGI